MILGVRVRREVNIKRASTHLQLPVDGMRRFKLQISACHINLAVSHAQSHQEHGGDGIPSQDTQEKEALVTVMFLLMVNICVHVPMSLRARTSAPDDWL